MTSDAQSVMEALAAAVLFTATFLFGQRVHPLRQLIRDRRSIASFGAGMSSAYVFIHLLPELQGTRETLSGAWSLPYEGMAVYFCALLGFLAFYGLEHFNRRTRLEADASTASAGGRAFKLHIAGFATYVWMIAYLLLHQLEETRVSLLLYAVALAFHLLSLDHSLEHEHGAAYRSGGRQVLAAMPLAGWATALLIALPPPILALMVAFVSGAVIMNSAVMELPSEKEGRFLAFLTGGLAYGIVLLLVSS